ncbi:MAG: hypothetical protein P9L92_04050 [Candidatus Electryonea clarkiae]|nr:hypothetical protein [Candidatus Electryonea clarkiae]MDP8286557.1 hypothetical protein [Candidatus Electryonea clarkiae]
MTENITALGITLTFLLGIWNLVVNYKNSRRTSFINTVTSERIKWIDKLRNNISDFCGLTYTWVMSELKEKPNELEYIVKIDNLRHLIRLQLNPDGALDQKIEELIAEIPTLTNSSQRKELRSAINTLIETTQKLLKEEWDKVKLESKSGDLKRK